MMDNLDVNKKDNIDEIYNNIIGRLEKNNGSVIHMLHECFREFRPNEEGTEDVTAKNIMLGWIITKLLEESTCDILKEITGQEWLYLLKCLTYQKMNIKI